MKATPVLLGLLLLGQAHAQHLKVSRSAWDGLQPSEREAIQAGHVVEVYENATYGVVVDAQGADRSDPGTSAGAVIGSVAAQAAYIDRAFSGGNNYSALTQLGLGILGGIAGSTLDRQAKQQYQFRYALRLSNGEIHYADATSADPFRHPPGLCLSLPDLRPISQSICAHGPDDLRRQHLGVVSPVPMHAHSAALAPQGRLSASTEITGAAPSPATSAAVMCRLGSLTPVSTTAEKCNAIGGVIQ